MIRLRSLPLLSLLAGYTRVIIAGEAEDKRAECLMWAHLENKTLPLQVERGQDEGHAHCSTNQECTGFVCEGTFKETPVKFGMNVLNCQEPPGLEIFGSAPHFLAANFSHVFKHGSKYEIPAAMLNVQEIPGVASLPAFPFGPTSQIPGMNLYFVVNMEPTSHNQTFNTLKIGLEVQACLNHSALANANVRKSKELADGEVCILKKPVIEDTSIPVPHCHTTYPAQPLVGDPCSINDLFACGDHQTCTQANPDSTSGLCECLSEFEKKTDRTCVSRAFVLPATSSIVSEPHQAGSESQSGAVAAGVISALIVIVALGIAVVMVHRYRLLPRLRAKLSNTPYEDIVISDRSQLATGRNHSLP